MTTTHRAPHPALEDPSGAGLIERVVDSRVIHRGRYATFRIDTVERADGSRSIRDIVGHPGVVAIVALDADDQVVLVRQYRVAAGRVLSEIPAGGLDPHDDGTTEEPLPAARRELEEETGLRAGSWQRLGEFYTAPGFSEELVTLYLATDLVAAGDERLTPDHDEHLLVDRMPWRDAVAAAERGEIVDAKSIVGLFWLERLRGGPLGD